MMKKRWFQKDSGPDNIYQANPEDECTIKLFQVVFFFQKKHEVGSLCF